MTAEFKEKKQQIEAALKLWPPETIEDVCSEIVFVLFPDKYFRMEKAGSTVSFLSEDIEVEFKIIAAHKDMEKYLVHPVEQVRELKTTHLVSSLVRHSVWRYIE